MPHYYLYIAAAWIIAFSACVAHAAEPKFERQTLDADIQIGYGLALGRVDADDKVDILLADAKEIVWYQNPGIAGQDWPKHVIARNLTAKDNVCLAARDIDGDGLVEIAVGANWNPGETTNLETSGTLFYLVRPNDPTKPWQPIPIQPHQPTTHRMHWLSNNDGMRLAVLPLHGLGNASGAGESVLISLFEVANDKPKLVSRIDTMMHMTHNFELITDAAFGDQQAMLVAGKEGYVVSLSNGESIPVVDSSVSKGAGEVRRYPVPERVFIGIEPMHGTDVVLYREQGEGQWNKQVIDTTLSQGHALAAANLCGSDTPEIVAGWRGRDANGKVGIKLYESQGDAWVTHGIDDNQIACEDLKILDLDGDGKADIIGAGRATKNLVVYWNQSN